MHEESMRCKTSKPLQNTSVDGQEKEEEMQENTIASAQQLQIWTDLILIVMGLFHF